MVRQMLKVNIADSYNYLWKRFSRERTISQKRKLLITRAGGIFTMGSCFAVEIKSALHRAGFDLYPKYQSIRYEPKKHTVPVAHVEELEAINHYNTFSIRQEFERIDGQWQQEPDDYWRVRTPPPERAVKGVETMVQDPYRRNIRAVNPTELDFLVTSLDRIIKDGFERSECFIFTLGLTEAWFRPSSGKAICQYPGYTYGGGGECTFRESSFEENLDNMRTVLSIVFRHKPHAKIFVTVSPVPLELTFSKRDVVVANMESKAILLAVAHRLCREYPQVTYFPSFEIVAFSPGAYKEDGRHVRQNVVEGIVRCFELAFVEREQATAAAAAP